MDDLDVGSLPVCDNGQLVGVITDRDITIRAIAKGSDPANTMVREIMTSEVLSCFENDDVEEAARIMQENQVRRILVLNAANEVAVQAFLEHRIQFPRIWGIVERALEECPFVAHPCLEELLDIDQRARELATRAI